MLAVRPLGRMLKHGLLGLAMVGSPQKIKAKLDVLVEQTQADELIFTSDLYEHADRIHSYELLSQVMKGA